MSDTSYYKPLPEKELSLAVVENTTELAEIYRKRKGHFYVYGWTGTGKSLVARSLTDIVGGDYFNYELLTLTQWVAQFKEIAGQLLASEKKVIVVDGFIPHCAGREIYHLLDDLTKKGAQLFIFSQYPPFDDSPGTLRRITLDYSAFTSIINLRFTDDDRRLGVELHLIN